MRFLFKTDYEDDIRLVPHSGYIVSYGILLALLVIAPFVLSSYIMSQLVFVCIYATVGVGLMILTGFTGQASLFPGRRAADGRRRRAGRISGPAAAGHLPGDRDDFLCPHRRGNPGALGKRHPWQ
jgi:hypothetical protein